MTREIQPSTAAKLLLAICIAGIFLVVADLVLIILAPKMLGPYFTTIAGACLIVAGFLGRRAIQKPEE